MSSRPTMAETAVAVPAAGSFHYRIPDHLLDRIEPGVRVLVPFGRRRVTGYVLGLMDEGDPCLADLSFKIKDIIEPLDEGPLFGPDLAEFFRFVAWYYHFPIGMVVAEGMPAGLKVMSLKTACITDEGRAALENKQADKAEIKLLERLTASKGAALTKLEKENREWSAMLRRFERLGWVTIDDRLGRDRVRPKTEKWLRLAGDLVGLSFRLGRREKELVELLKTRDEASFEELKPDFPTLAAMVRRLREKKWIEVEERTVYRDALGRALHISADAPTLTPAQSDAVSAITSAIDDKSYTPFLLHGVTGSGKTEVYLAAARHALDCGRSVLWLVPEISLTPVVEGLVRARFREEIAVLHSGLTDAERYDQWMKIRNLPARIVIGARSAIFAPLENLGLIVVDEEHDGAYKQEDHLRYQARDLAVLRAQRSNAAVVLGSATPSMETYRSALSGRYRLLRLLERVGEGRLPLVDIVDMRRESGQARRPLTAALKNALKETLEEGRQALLFINRRGTAALPMCLSCGHVIKCVNCSVTLTLHQESDGRGGRLNCHHCGYEIPPPEICPECRSKLFRYMGVGTEKLEQEVQKAFPNARVGRLDADTARPKGELARILGGLRDRKLDVLVGTQMVTKGHDFPGITLVGVIDADLGLHLPDFRAGERTFQLMAQVAGRAGRGKDPGKVIIQTFTPDHYTLQLAREHDFVSFYDQEIGQREDLGYPPFSRLTLARFQGNDEDQAGELAEEAARLGRAIVQKRGWAGIDILGPAPAPLARIKKKYRFQLLVRGDKVGPLHEFLHIWDNHIRAMLKGGGVVFSLDIDPHNMM